MASTRMSLASGRNSVSPTIAHLGNVRAHCLLQSRLIQSVPGPHRRVLQPHIRAILEEKSRPATMGEALTTRRNNARTADAAKRRGLDPSVTDVQPLKYSPIDRPARFATPQRRPRQPLSPRTNQGLWLLSQCVVSDMDRRAMNLLCSLREVVCVEMILKG